MKPDLLATVVLGCYQNGEGKKRIHYFSFLALTYNVCLFRSGRLQTMTRIHSSARLYITKSVTIFSNYSKVHSN